MTMAALARSEMGRMAGAPERGSARVLGCGAAALRLRPGAWACRLPAAALAATRRSDGSEVA